MLFRLRYVLAMISFLGFVLMMGQNLSIWTGITVSSPIQTVLGSIQALACASFPIVVLSLYAHGRAIDSFRNEHPDLNFNPQTVTLANYPGSWLPRFIRLFSLYIPINFVIGLVVFRSEWSKAVNLLITSTLAQLHFVLIFYFWRYQSPQRYIEAYVEYMQHTSSLEDAETSLPSKSFDEVSTSRKKEKYVPLQLGIGILLVVASIVLILAHVATYIGYESHIFNILTLASFVFGFGVGFFTALFGRRIWPNRSKDIRAEFMDKWPRWRLRLWYSVGVLLFISTFANILYGIILGISNGVPTRLDGSYGTYTQGNDRFYVSEENLADVTWIEIDSVVTLDDEPSMRESTHDVTVYRKVSEAFYDHNYTPGWRFALGVVAMITISLGSHYWYPLFALVNRKSTREVKTQL